MRRNRPPIPPTTPVSAARTLVSLGAGLAALMASVLAPATAMALGYVESSAGLIPPSLEGGNTEVEFADVNADGHPDLVSIGDHGCPGIGSDQHGIMVWLGDGAGNWAVTMNGDFGYGGIALGDLNGDGHLDAAYGMHHNYSSTDFGNQFIEAALGDGTGSGWTPWDDGLATSGESYGMFETDLADFDNDGDLDIVCKSFGCCNGVRAYRNNGDGTWTVCLNASGGNAGDGITAGDINADGNADFVVAKQYGTVYLGDGEGGFTVADGNLPGGGTFGPTGVSLGDIDNDGDLDIAYKGPTAGLEVWKWDPSGIWSNASAGLPTSGIAATQLADMDGDGFCDVIGLGNGILRVWLGDGGTTWTLATTINLPSPGSFQALRAGGDVDHNGRPEIAVITEQGSWPSYINRFRVFRETTPATSLTCRFESPKGGETLVSGSVRFIDWGAECPGGDAGTVDIDLSLSGSDGPWTPIASALPNNGRYQWTVPVVPPTADAHLRLRVTTSSGTAEASSPGPFAILPPTSESAADLIRSTGLHVIPNPASGPVRLAGAIPHNATIEVLDLAGRRVRALSSGTRVWDGRDARGVQVPGGIYFLRTATGTARVLLVR